MPEKKKTFSISRSSKVKKTCERTTILKVAAAFRDYLHAFMAQSQKRIWFWWQNSQQAAQSMFQDDEKMQIRSLRETEENTDVDHTWSLCTSIPYRLQKSEHENIVSFAKPVLQHAVPCCFQLTLPLATFLHSRSSFWAMLWQLTRTQSSNEKITHFLNYALFWTVLWVQYDALIKLWQKHLFPSRPPSPCLFLRNGHLPQFPKSRLPHSPSWTMGKQNSHSQSLSLEHPCYRYFPILLIMVPSNSKQTHPPSTASFPFIIAFLTDSCLLQSVNLGNMELTPYLPK